MAIRARAPEADRVATSVRPAVRRMTAYGVAEHAGLIRLDAMENPYRWPEELTEQWLERLRAVEVNRYPDPGAGALKAALAEWLQLGEETALVLGNGSDELIQTLCLALAGPEPVVLAPEPGFVMYRLIAEATGLRYVGVPLRAADFGLDRAAMLAAIETHRPALVFLANPNNPTGNCFDDADLEAVIEAAPGLVVVDEAYYPFAGRSQLPALARHGNLAVMQTLSKLGLAGLRLGLLVLHPLWARELDKVRLPYNVNVLSQVTAQFMLEHREVLDAQAQAIRADRDRLRSALAGRPGVRVWPSQANFLLLRLETADAAAAHAALKEAGILVKLLHGSHPLLAGCLRITVGTPEQNRLLLEALDRFLAA